MLNREQQEIVDLIVNCMISLPMECREEFGLRMLAIYRKLLAKHRPDMPIDEVIQNMVNLTDAVVRRGNEIIASGGEIGSA